MARIVGKSALTLSLPPSIIEPNCYSSLGSIEVDDRESTEKLIQFLMGERGKCKRSKGALCM